MADGALWAAALVGVLGIVAATVIVIRAEEHSALALARESLSRTATSMAAHAERVFADAERRLVEGSLLLPLITPEEIGGRVGANGGSQQGRSTRAASAVVLIDAEGIVLAPELLRGQSHAADPLIRAALAHPAHEMIAGDPRENGKGGALVIPMAMRATPNAHGVAVLATSVALEPFLDLFSQVRPAGLGGAVLFREDGMPMARQPFRREDVGRVLRGGPVAHFARTDPDVVDVIGQIDGVPRLVAFHRAGRFPFYTIVAAERAAVLAAPMGKARVLAAVAGLACVLVLAGAAYAARQRRRDAAQVAALEASHRAMGRLATIVEETQASVIVTDADGRTEWVNPAFTRTTGFTLADMAGRKPGELLQGAETDADTARLVGEAVRGGRPFDVEILNYTKDGSPCWIRLAGNPVRDAGGTVVRFIAVQFDVTARRAAERHAAELARLSALGQLAGGVAHDINNLLMVISLNLELLTESGLGRESEALAAAALAATIRGHDITRQLLSIAQRSTDARRETDIAPLLGTVLPLLAKTMPEGVRLVTDLRIPDACRCRGDPGGLESALTNLVVNARDALAGGGTIVVECAGAELAEAEAARLAIPPGHYVSLAVSDDGPGIPQELLGRVLEPFFTTKPSGKGTGLGLAIAYGFARQAGGTLTLASTPGKGTTARILLPVAQEDTPQAGPSPSPPMSLRGLSVLVVEDDPQILVLLERMLRAAGLEVTLALDSAQARASLAAVRPDVLLTDVRLVGGASGIDLAREARAMWPRLPVIFMTGDPGPDFAERIAPFEDMTVLAKPFGRTDLMEAFRLTASLAERAPAGQLSP